MDSTNEDYIHFFRQSSPYIHAHRGITFVIMLPGESLDSDHFSHIVSDIALLNSLGIRLVLIHGARSQIDERLIARKIKTAFCQGYRITDRESLTSVIDAVASQRVKLEGQLSMGLINSPMHSAQVRVISGNFVTARPIGVINGTDFQHTGEVRRIDRTAINKLLDDGYLVLLSCLGYSPTGEVFNLLAEDVATHTAISLEAGKLIMLASDIGLKNDNGELIRTMRPSEVRSLLHKRHDECSAEELRLMKASLKAYDGGILRIHIISHTLDGTLLQELFTRQGCGTLITQDMNAFEQLRPGTLDDIGGILNLIEPLEETGVLLRRSRGQLEQNINTFKVIVRDGMIIGCASLHPYQKERCAELACFVVHPDYRGGNRGNLLLEHIEQEALRQGLKTLFVLTTRTAHWFVERGFSTEEIVNLPEEKQLVYNRPRNSKMFLKVL